MKSKNIKLFYITVPSKKEADNIASTLVKEQLVACANISGDTMAIYRWKGIVTKEKEVIIILKTTTRLVKKVIKRVVELHSYQCPAVIVLDVHDGNSEFLKWINQNTLDK